LDNGKKIDASYGASSSCRAQCRQREPASVHDEEPKSSGREAGAEVAPNAGAETKREAPCMTLLTQSVFDLP